MADQKHRTEQVYDDEISPLVARLIEIATREGIPLLVSAGMTMEDGAVGCCTTFIGALGWPELACVQNRYSLCVDIVCGHSGGDTAAGAIITRHHAEVPRD